MKISILIPLALFSLLTGCKNNENNNGTESKTTKAETKVLTEEFTGLKGEWQYEYNPNNENVPQTLFTLKIISTANGEFQAQYCAVAQSGNRIDCSSDPEINVQGNFKANKVLASFYSFFDPKKTKGEVELAVLNKDSIRWIVKKADGFDYYAPKTCILTRVKKEANEDCKDIEIEMGSGRECILKNTDLETAYRDLIKNKEVEDANYYLSEIPKANTSVEVNKNGLIAIDYTISNNKIEISMSYQGGVTEVTLEKIKTDVKRSIYHYAD
ncbi:MAG: hypothetical protein ABI441_05610 [Flavobacterium sp.]